MEFVPAAFNVIILLAPPSMVYVTVALGVPVKVMDVVLPEQMVVVPLMVAVGNAFTVTTADCPDIF